MHVKREERVMGGVGTVQRREQAGFSRQCARMMKGGAELLQIGMVKVTQNIFFSE